MSAATPPGGEPGTAPQDTTDPPASAVVPPPVGPADRDEVVVLDYGGQYSQLIARRIRELGVFCELLPHHAGPDEVRRRRPRGVVLSGGPASVYADGAPALDRALLELGVPVLGLCYGMQLMAHELGGTVRQAPVGEYGRTRFDVVEPGLLLRGTPGEQQVWMSHRDAVFAPPPGATVLGGTGESPVAAFEDRGRGLYAIQYHPEVVHTPYGQRVLETFLSDACGCDMTWSAAGIAEEQIARVRAQVGEEGRAICGLSGGVDSSVAALLVHRAIGDRLTCVLVDHGLLRRNEAEQVVAAFRDHFRVPLVVVDARERFLARLAGLTEPEAKRKAIGEEFIRVFEDEAARLAGEAAPRPAGGEVVREAAAEDPDLPPIPDSVSGPGERAGGDAADGGGDGDGDGAGGAAETTPDGARFLVQGTLYSDVIESGGGTGAATIKSHHNVGGLPDDVEFELVEPLRELFKDEVRAVGAELGLPERLVWRQPFPGPGLGIRIVGGEVTRERLDLLRDADAILQEEIRAAGLYRDLWQSFCVLPVVRTVGVQGDERSYGYVVAIRAVTSDDAMTADWARLPHDLLDRVASRMVGELRLVNRVVYDVTSKPPGTIEWE